MPTQPKVDSPYKVVLLRSVVEKSDWSAKIDRIDGILMEKRVLQGQANRF